MLSVDGRLIVRRVAVWAAGREHWYRYNSGSCCRSTTTTTTTAQHHRKHTLLHSSGKFHTQKGSQEHTRTWHWLGHGWGGALLLMDCLECMGWRSMGWGRCTVHLRRERWGMMKSKRTFESEKDWKLQQWNCNKILGRSWVTILLHSACGWFSINIRNNRFTSILYLCPHVLPHYILILADLPRAKTVCCTRVSFQKYVFISGACCSIISTSAIKSIQLGSGMKRDNWEKTKNKNSSIVTMFVIQSYFINVCMWGRLNIYNNILYTTIYIIIFYIILN